MKFYFFSFPIHLGFLDLFLFLGRQVSYLISLKEITLDKERQNILLEAVKYFLNKNLTFHVPDGFPDIKQRYPRFLVCLHPLGNGTFGASVSGADSVNKQALLYTLYDIDMFCGGILCYVSLHAWYTCLSYATLHVYLQRR